MLQGTIQAMGGLGLFLLGMVIMTDGLRGLAGNLMHRALTQFTRSPLSGAVTGTVSTAVLQSSSATTVAAVGFVGAGLLTFPQALGIVFGANIGTTFKGWVIALIGFKFQLGAAMMPFILVGVMFRLFGKGRSSSAGLAMAGFGLLFLGITTLQAGMEGLQDIITPAVFPGDTMIGRLQLLLIGMVITIFTQSSSAGVAATLTVLHAGSIALPQACALVIGMDIGTTVTAVLATIGGSVETRRTGYSHVIYNLIVGAGALIFLTPYLLVAEHAYPGISQSNPEVALVAFHTIFNIIGAGCMLPFAGPFARMVQHMVPARDTGLSRHLDNLLLKDKAVAMGAVKKAVNGEISALLKHVTDLLSGKKKRGGGFLNRYKTDMDITKQYVDQIHLTPEDGEAWESLLECMHTIDHLTRLYDRCYEDCERVQMVIGDPMLVEYGHQLLSSLEKGIQSIRDNDWENACNIAKEASRSFTQDKGHLRDAIMSKVANGMLSVDEGNRQLESARWLRRVAQHMEGILCHAWCMNELRPIVEEIAGAGLQHTAGMDV